MANLYRTVLLFGAPGAGKGTQGSILGQIPGFWHCACGDVFRNIDITSPLGRQFYEYSSRGELVPDELTVELWAESIHARATLGHYKPRIDLLVLDGIPRTVKQAELMQAHIKVLQLIHLVCPDEEKMFERLRRRALKENRPDDADEKVIRNRWQVYERETKPVLDFYGPDMIREVDAMAGPSHVLHDVLEHVVPAQEAHFKGTMD